MRWSASSAAIPEICDLLGLGIAFTKIWDQPPVRFHEDVRAEAAAARPARSRDMVWVPATMPPMWPESRPPP